MRARLAVLVSVCILLLVFVVWHLRSTRLASQPAASATSKGTSPPGTTIPATPESAPTAVYAHNLMLRKGPDFRIYVRWLRGNMVRTRRDVNPTFDDPESFLLEIKTGVIRANIGDVGNFLNAGGVAQSPLKNVKLVADGDQIKLTGTVRKVVPLSIEMKGTVAPASGNRIQIHVTKLSVLKIPFKGLLGAFHVDISDLFD